MRFDPRFPGLFVALGLAGCAGQEAETTTRRVNPALDLAALGPLPSARQLAWAQLEYYAFVHFNMNTFSGREWGDGNESPSLFAPSALDCRQWARVAVQAGMKGIILTAKHHDGFIRPSKYTRTRSLPWREGMATLRELSDAREAGLKFGVYLSPWDRHSPLYGDSQKYNDYYAAQLEELLTNYGEVFEVWWDGACGEGPNGKRQVYDFERFTQIVRRLQPGAVIFSDIGPDVRWVGNESGFAGETCWSMLNTAGFARGIGAPPTVR
jgi:alpha-L-fucosidase